MWDVASSIAECRNHVSFRSYRHFKNLFIHSPCERIICIKRMNGQKQTTHISTNRTIRNFCVRASNGKCTCRECLAHSLAFLIMPICSRNTLEIRKSHILTVHRWFGAWIILIDHRMHRMHNALLAALSRPIVPHPSYICLLASNVEFRLLTRCHRTDIGNSSNIVIALCTSNNGQVKTLSKQTQTYSPKQK